MAQRLSKVCALISNVVGATAATALVSTSTVLAEAGNNNNNNKKSIYDTEQREIPTQTLEPTRLTALLRETREEAAHYLSMAKTHGQIVVDRWIDTEKRFAALVKRTVPEGEKLAPGIIYVGRNFAVRYMSPLLFGTAAGFYFLPGTSNVILRNVWGRYGDPTTIDKVKQQWEDVKQAQRDARGKVTEAVQELRMSLQEGRGYAAKTAKEIADKTPEPVKQVVEDVQKKAVEVTKDISAKVADKKDQIVEAVKDKAASLPIGFTDNSSK
ncbi:hypothetical protein DL89DRAFT_268606 [Linderina pennispora]|uniref:MICOS complex subunit n=1 Tax=Linderina pennispora TaxID=61395 RepID=A0A1Y1W625_9FUNG|nr:uncharacterized protein DL89DRAFT_268606 [Linderina pennispora]ORX68835.1 hypothetical protein DL89DRAFT_268606 [Linderina pennispora]